MVDKAGSAHHPIQIPSNLKPRIRYTLYSTSLQTKPTSLLVSLPVPVCLGDSMTSGTESSKILKVKSLMNTSNCSQKYFNSFKKTILTLLMQMCCIDSDQSGYLWHFKGCHLIQICVSLRQPCVCAHTRACVCVCVKCNNMVIF